MADVTLHGISKRFTEANVLEAIDLEIASGEFVALLGPSGCGKTTLLRIIAGLERPSLGEVRIGGLLMVGANTFVPAEERRLGMVFQSYALWPHMSVADNIAFGLKVRRMRHRERAERVERAMAVVGLDGLGGRRPAQLSGGQRQRAALARCLVLEPELILLDEPLANLDAHLRLQMQAEFRRIHRETGTTFVFVTHDQVEAMALANRIAVMNRGRIEQTGSPEVLYRQPATAMVAGFFGKGVVLPAEVLSVPALGRVVASIAGSIFEFGGAAPTGPALVSLRPEHLSLVRNRPALAAVATYAWFRGEDYLVSFVLPELGGIMIELALATAPAQGERVSLGIKDGWVIPTGLSTR
ncbi:MAG: ABC transporter ATP-binding protein [Alphaproteobacteria bacterium]|nr:ABC transporter ATP-binding protein [Alphaproteobacteria bacterium]